VSETTTLRCDGYHPAGAVPEYIAAVAYYGEAPHHRWPPKGWVTITVEDHNAVAHGRKLLLCPDCSKDAGAAIYPLHDGTDDFGHAIEVGPGTLAQGYGGYRDRAPARG
jgi:hypothetical protein